MRWLKPCRSASRPNIFDLSFSVVANSSLQPFSWKLIEGIIICYMSKSRSRKARITCEDDLFEDLTNRNTPFTHTRPNRFSFEEENNYRIEVAAMMDENRMQLELIQKHKEGQLPQAFRKVKHTTYD